MPTIPVLDLRKVMSQSTLFEKSKLELTIGRTGAGDETFFTTDFDLSLQRRCMLKYVA